MIRVVVVFVVADFLPVPDPGSVLWTRIRSIRMFFGLPDPHLDRLVTSLDPAPHPASDPSIIKKKLYKIPEFLPCFVTSS